MAADTEQNCAVEHLNENWRVCFVLTHHLACYEADSDKFCTAALEYTFDLVAFVSCRARFDQCRGVVAHEGEGIGGHDGALSVDLLQVFLVYRSLFCSDQLTATHYPVVRVKVYAVCMCASTGLRHGGFSIGVDGQVFDPLDEREVAAEIAAWWDEQRGQMKITGRIARNLNPLIVSAGSSRALRFAWWWLWPTGDGPAKFSAFNARNDKLTGRAWSKPFQHRALIPASWYVEKGVRFEHQSGETFGIAAITSSVIEPDGTELLTYAMVTREAAGEASDTWHRMPLALPPERHGEWLDPHRTGDAEFASEVTAWSEQISREMRPVESATAAPRSSQITLF